MAEKIYNVELTESQMKVISLYLETTFRLFLGQDWLFTDALAMMNTNLSSGDQKQFDKYIMRRDHAREVMKAVYQIAWGPRGYLDCKTDDMLEVETIIDAIKCALGNNRWSSPTQMGHEPIPKINEIKENKE